LRKVLKIDAKLVTVFSRNPASGKLEKLPDISVAPATGLQPEIIFAQHP
jgi:hypothetical protein